MNLARTVLANRSVALKAATAARPIFSQLGEDVALTRLMHPTRAGTYVDVGANDPFDGSNTAYLYYRGWTGLTIDPNPMFTSRFRKSRPRDIHLTEGVSLLPGDLEYQEFENDKFNTFSAERAEQLVREGHAVVRKTRVPCRPLAETVSQNLRGRHVDLLSVDCEGLDLEVLESAKLEEMRPTVILVEDFSEYIGFRDLQDQGRMPHFLRSKNYAPVYQCAWSAMYVHRNWRDQLFTGAYDPPRNPSDYMPS